MAHTREYCQIARVRVKIATGTYGGGVPGRSQTVNVFDQSATEGNYRQVYRSRARQNWVNAAGIGRHCRSFYDLEQYLAARGYEKEGPRRTR